MLCSFKFSLQRKLDDGDEPVKPSCVLHLRGLPGDVTEAEVAALGQPFGTVNDVILTRNKNQVKANIFVSFMAMIVCSFLLICVIRLLVV